MKLGEALNERKSLLTQIGELRARISNNLVVAEDEEPTESPDDLYTELVTKTGYLRDLVTAINNTNTTATIDGKMTITEAIAKRDYLGSLHASARSIVEGAQAHKANRRSYGYTARTRDEIKDKATIKVSEYQKHSDEYAQQRRALDAKIQEANWATDLIN